MAGAITRAVRLSRILAHKAERNQDLIWFTVSLAGAFTVGLYGETILTGNLGSIATIVVMLAVEILAVVKKLYSPQGDITARLVESGQKPLSELKSDCNTCLSTDFQVMFEEETQKKMMLLAKKEEANDVTFSKTETETYKSLLGNATDDK